MRFSAVQRQEQRQGMRYRLAIFDFDGTLLDSFSWFVTAVDEMAREFGFRSLPREELEALRGMPAREIVRRLDVPLWKMPRVANRMRSLMARDLDALRLFPGIRETLVGLDDHGVALAIVSSNSAANIQKVLGDLGASIAHYECGVSMFGKASRLKRVLRRLDVSAADALYVGDELRDVDAAHAAGMAFGAVSWGYTLPDALKAANPELFFETSADLLEALVASRGFAPSIG